MTQAPIDYWNVSPLLVGLRETLGMKMIEADEDHVLFEVRATDFNKWSGYFAGFALLAIAEHAPGMLAGYREYSADPESATPRWLMTQVNTNFISNTRGDAIQCEATWAVRGDAQCIVNTEIRDGDHIILHSTSTHTKR